MARKKEEWKEKNLHKIIETEKKKLPLEERKRMEEEDARKRRLELKRMKESLWKMRNKEKKYDTRT